MNNGPIWNKVAQEFEIWLDGEFIQWASNDATAEKIYNQARTTKYKHQKLNNEPAWEWYTLKAPNKEITMDALDTAIKGTEPLQPFKVQNGLSVACSYCEEEARKEGIPLAYNPDEASHGICPKHFQEQVEIVERWAEKQKNTIKVQY